MKQLIIFATGNRNKIHEILEIIDDPSVTVMSMKEAGVAADPEEDGSTFEENALLKARAWASASGLPSLADDSGLEVAALGGAPGVHSARAVPGDDSARNAWLLAQLGDREDRRARFVAALALVTPEGKEFVCEGECPGRIAFSPSGAGGFGYDPLFLPDGVNASFADIPAETKNAISHRAAAVRALLKIL